LRIRVIGHSGELSFPFGESGPWREFRNEIETRSNSIISGDYSEPSDAIIVNHHNDLISQYMNRHNIPLNKRILVIWEPYIVETTRYKKEVLEQYGKVYCPSLDWAERVGGSFFNWPQDSILSSECNSNWEQRLNRAAIIQGNKYSARKGEMYSLRRRVLKKDSSTNIDLFGTDWNKGLSFDWWHWSRSLIGSRIRDTSISSIYGIGRRYKQYKGKVEVKSQILQQYKVAIVIENSLDFVSEKLFDAVRNGCVVIYVGPNLSKYGFQHESILQVKPDEKEILNKLSDLLKLSSNILLQKSNSQIEEFISISDRWENTKVLKTLASDMSVYLNQI